MTIFWISREFAEFSIDAGFNSGFNRKVKVMLGIQHHSQSDADQYL